MIEFSDISIVVQGAVAPKITSECLRQLRQAFTGAQIILSTWTGTDVSGLEFDTVVFSDDPKSQKGDITGIPNNVNRQLVSTKAGIAAANRKYILKTRTDIIIHSSSFINYFGKYDSIPSRFFKNRILICDFYTRSPRILKMCFHPSDWIAFGNADDIRSYYYSVELQTDGDSAWFEKRRKTKKLFPNYISKYTPEQYIFLSFLRSFGKVRCSCYYDCDPELTKQTERALAECFVVLDYGKQLDITFAKYDPDRYRERYTLISFWQWKALYKHYCRKKASVLWLFYQARPFFLKAVKRLRRGIVWLLDILGLKEYVKSMLAKLYKSQI